MINSTVYSLLLQTPERGVKFLGMVPSRLLVSIPRIRLFISSSEHILAVPQAVLTITLALSRKCINLTVYNLAFP